MAKTKVVNPPPDLEPREVDIKVPELLFAQLPPFSKLSRRPNLDKFPKAVVLRRYRRGDVICRQGEPGGTAFYILTSQEVDEYRHRVGFGEPTRVDGKTTAAPPAASIELQYDLQLMPSIAGVSGIPPSGKKLIMVAVVNKVLSFRIFNCAGNVAVDTDEYTLTQPARQQARQIEDLRKLLENLWPPHELSKSEKDQLSTVVKSICGYTPEPVVPTGTRKASCDLQLMPPLNDVSGIPTEGKDLIIVASVNQMFYIRVFNSAGEMVKDTDENTLTEPARQQARQIEDLRKRFESFCPPHDLYKSENDRLITATDIMSIVGYTPEVAIVHLATPKSAEPPGRFQSLKRRLFRGRIATVEGDPPYIPIDGPRDLDYASGTGVMYEGELFGEMSCLYRSPRSATVVAARSCYVLEMLRNVLDQMLKDPQYKEDTNQTYQKRLLELHLREIPLMNLLDDRMLGKVRDSAQLVEYQPGELIYDEHDSSDCMHLIRRGIVKVMKSVSYLFAEGEIEDAAVLSEELLEGKDAATGPKRTIWERLTKDVRDAVEQGALDVAGLAGALNALVKDDTLADAAGLDELARARGIGLAVWQRLADPRHGSVQELRRCQRLLLNSACPAVLKSIPIKNDDETSEPIRPERVVDWKALVAGLSGVDPPTRRVRTLLPEAARSALQKIDQFDALSDADQAALIAGLNHVLEGQPLVLAKEFQERVRKQGAAIVRRFLPNHETWSDHDYQRFLRAYNRFLLTALYPKGLGCELRLMSSVKNISDLPREGKNLIVVAAVSKVLHFRIFDSDGKKVADTDEKSLTANIPQIKALKKELESLWLSGETTENEKELIIDAVTSIVGHARLKNASHRGKLPRTLVYRGRGEFIGEMSLMEDRPRSATCVAYNHPEDDPERDAGSVQLIRIGKDLFEQLKAGSEPFHRQIEATVAKRHADTKRILATSSAVAGTLPLDSAHSEQLGLIEGRSLMLIDLDRCTRCDECVRACVGTHDDGRSRLFLDGPRFGNYLVPTTCRSCLDPVCMIGCPVGSIQRGPNDEMVIKDWCIGCEQCANQCPYGAIQMYDIGVVPEVTHGWRFQLASAVTGSNWHSPHERQDHTWATGCSPFNNERDFQAELKLANPGLPNPEGVNDSAICFRLEFNVAAEVLRRKDGYRLGMSTMAAELVAWVNGRKVELSRSDKRREGRSEFEGHLEADVLNRKGNLLAVQVIPTAGAGDLILSARIDEVHRPDLMADLGDEIVQKLVTEHAVVCDLCSSLSNGPACVNVCPHDAALRIDVPDRVLSAGLTSEKRG